MGRNPDVAGAGVRLSVRKTGPCILLAGCALVLYLIVAFSAARTSDEESHYHYGWMTLLGRTERSRTYWDSKMPVSALNVLPHFVTQTLVEGKGLWLGQIDTGMLRAARMVTIAASIGLMALLMTWSTRLWGRHAGLAAGVLFCLSPNLMAHGTLITSDLYMSLATVAVMFTHWQLAQTWRAQQAAAAAVTLAAALLTKYSSLLLIPIVFLALLPSAWIELQKNETRKLARSLATYVLTALIAGVLIINIAFSFNGTFTPLRDYQFRTTAFQRLAHIPVLSGIPLPLPVPFLDGVDYTRAHELSGETFGNPYLLGEVRPYRNAGARPFYSYYLVAYAFKEPIAFQLLLLAAFAGLTSRFNFKKFALNEWFMICPVLLYFIYLSFFTRAQFGLRHWLIVFPFSILIISSQFRGWPDFTGKKRLTLIALLLYAAISVFSYFPQMIPYMNELVIDRRYSWKILADSNLSWGQNEDVVARFLRANPDVKLNPHDPVTGRVLVNANSLVGVNPIWNSTWLLKFPPQSYIGYAHLLYMIPPGQPVAP